VPMASVLPGPSWWPLPFSARAETAVSTAFMGGFHGRAFFNRSSTRLRPSGKDKSRGSVRKAKRQGDSGMDLEEYGMEAGRAILSGGWIWTRLHRAGLMGLGSAVAWKDGSP
jgi:hypothetical protein